MGGAESGWTVKGLISTLKVFIIIIFIFCGRGVTVMNSHDAVLHSENGSEGG